MVTRVVERSPLLRAKPMMQDASTPTLTDNKDGTTTNGRYVGEIPTLKACDTEGSLPATKGRERENSVEKDIRSSLGAGSEEGIAQLMQVSHESISIF